MFFNSMNLDLYMVVAILGQDSKLCGDLMRFFRMILKGGGKQVGADKKKGMLLESKVSHCFKAPCKSFKYFPTRFR